jgi:cell wall-associated NlpC family hydrolase
VRVTLRSARAALLAAAIGLSVSACASHPAARPPAFPESDGRARTTRAILATAFDLLGTPYRYGGQVPSLGFDCSGFVRYVLGLHAIQMPRTVAEQFEIGQTVRPEQVRPGDLVFFSTVGAGPTHIGIVVDMDDPQFIHAPDAGGRVRVERYDTPYWRARWIGARRVY